MVAVVCLAQGAWKACHTKLHFTSGKQSRAKCDRHWCYSSLPQSTNMLNGNSATYKVSSGQPPQSCFHTVYSHVIYVCSQSRKLSRGNTLYRRHCLGQGSDPVGTIMSSGSLYLYSLFKFNFPGANSRIRQKVIEN